MEQSDLTNFAIPKSIDVSRETIDRLIIYHHLLIKWQRSINLVSPKTIDVAWERHFIDSMQLFPLISDIKKPIFDLGSGGGFPGMVLSIMGADAMYLIESDQRKCVFLSEVARETAASVQIHNKRIESFQSDVKASTITARALTSLKDLLSYAEPLLAEGGECLFLKGKGIEQEMAEAEEKFSFHVERHQSLTDEEGSIIKILNIKKKG